LDRGLLFALVGCLELLLELRHNLVNGQTDGLFKLIELVVNGLPQLAVVLFRYSLDCLLLGLQVGKQIVNARAGLPSRILGFLAAASPTTAVVFVGVGTL